LTQWLLTYPARVKQPRLGVCFWSADALGEIEDGEQGGEATEEQTQGPFGEAPMQAGAEVAADEPAGAAEQSEVPFGGDVAGGRCRSGVDSTGTVAAV
jgi:hypothetical protein